MNSLTEKHPFGAAKNSDPETYKIYVQRLNEIIDATFDNNDFCTLFVDDMLTREEFTLKQMIAIDNIHRNWAH